MKNRRYTRVLGRKNIVLRKGLKQTHIGNDVWLIGKVSKVDGRKHQVVYGPNRKEYHLWDADVDFVNNQDEPYYDEYHGVTRTVSSVNRHGNTAFNNKLKIYILTHILDDRDNWCFDLSVVPPVGKLKVIYDNGTVKNVQFDGVFAPTSITKTWTDHRGMKKTYGAYDVKPIGYRKS